MSKANQIHEQVSEEANFLDMFQQETIGWISEGTTPPELTPFADILEKARDDDPFEYVRVIKLIQSAYANLRSTIAETHFALEDLNGLTDDSDMAA